MGAAGKRKSSNQRILHKRSILNPHKLESTKSFCISSASFNDQNSAKSSFLYQPNTMGITGGVSTDSTLDFINKIVKWSDEDKEESNGLPFVLCSAPVINKSLLRHDDSLEMDDHTQIVEKLKQKRAFLERSGAGCIVMPCHVLHSWYDEVSKGCSVLLHMGECIAKELKEAKLKPIEAGSPLRIGVLATNAILKAGFYQDQLQKEGFEVVLLEAINRNDIKGAQNLLRIALQVLLVRAVNTIILASDDMRTLLPQDDPLLRKCVDPLDALARSTIKYSQSAINGS